MSNDASTSTQAQHTIDHNLAERAIQTGQDHIEEAREELPDSFDADLDDVKDRLEIVEDAIDDDQDGMGENPVGPIPATLDYLQHVVENLNEQADSEGLEALEEDLEAIEETVDEAEIEQTKWYAGVNDIPDLYSEQEVSPTALKQQGGIDGNPNDYKLHALATPTAGIDDPVETIPPNDNDPVDLREGRYTHFATEKTDGGVV